MANKKVVKDLLNSEDFKSIYSRVPKVTVSLVIKTKGGIALSLRNLPSWYNQWHLPGGSIFYNEFVEDAVHRKAKEELGIKVKIVKFLGIIQYPSEQTERGFGWSVDLIYLCKYSGKKFTPDADSKEVGVFKKLPKNTIFEQAQFLKKHWKEIQSVYK